MSIALFLAWHPACIPQSGQYSGYTTSGPAINIAVDTSIVRLTFYRSDILRIDLLPSSRTVCDSSFVVIQESSGDVPVHVVDADSTLEISSPAVVVHFRKSPFRISFSDAAGKTVLVQDLTLTAGIGREARFLLHRQDHFYGTGERGMSLDLRGQSFDSYNTQKGWYSSAPPAMNINIPFVTTPNGYALLFDNISRGHFDFGESDPSRWSYNVHNGVLTQYLIVAQTPVAQLAAYRWLTGKQPLPPRWAFGFLLSKNRYANEPEVRAIVDTLRLKKFPCDGIVLDLAWFNRMGDLAWDTASWPHPQQMMADFRSMGIKTVVITEPYLVTTSSNFRTAVDSNFLATDSLGKPFLLGDWWSCEKQCSAALVDLTNPRAQRWWWKMHPLFMGDGVAGLWTDLGEPERHPEGMHHYLGPAEQVHNIYNLLWARTIFEGMSSFRPGKRVFNLTRSGFGGIQRYGVITWSGDVARDFGGLAVQVPFLLNMGMSGVAYHNSDIGGYARMPTTAELYVRWMQFGTFCPITRAHGSGEVVGGSPTEPWRFGKQAEDICREYIALRYRLLPYIYTMAFENYQTGMPLARPLAIMFPNDTSLANVFDSYMWGDAFLVSPVTREGQTTKSLYLPEGEWIDFWSEQLFHGGQTITIPTPLERLPLFVKAGSLIPMGPTMNCTDERAADPITIHIYPAAGKSQCRLYEDDGITDSYQSGSYATTTFSQSLSSASEGRAQLQLTIGPSKGNFTGKVQVRKYIAEIHGVAENAGAVDISGRQRNELDLQGNVQTADGFTFNRLRSRLTISVTCNTDSAYTLTIHDLKLH